MLASIFSRWDLRTTKGLVKDFGEWHIEVNLIDGEHRNLLSVV